jgi:hypothetical protein
MRSSTTRRLAIAVAIAVLTVQAGVALATPGVGISATVLGQGTFSERVKVNTPNIKAKIKPSDFIVQEVVVEPGGHTGWHSHPGPALVTIQEGTFTLYDGDEGRRSWTRAAATSTSAATRAPSR